MSKVVDLAEYRKKRRAEYISKILDIQAAQLDNLYQNARLVSNARRLAARNGRIRKSGMTKSNDIKPGV